MVQVGAQLIPTLQAIEYCLAYGASGHQRTAAQLIGHPFYHRIDHRQALLQPQLLSLRCTQLLFSGIRLHLIQRLNKAHGDTHPFTL